MQIIYATDLHGNRKAYQRLFEEAVSSSCKAVVIGGDLLPKKGFIRDSLVEQRGFIETFLAPLVCMFRENHPGIDVLWMFGNDDWAVNEDILITLDEDGIAYYLHNRVVETGGLKWAGYANVPLTPFSIKDWERFDTPDQEVPVLFAPAMTSSIQGKIPIDIKSDIRTKPTIQEDLNELATRCPANKTIFVVHSPPYGTKLDIMSRHEHVGSRALLEFIEKHQPPLTLHGHIHESPAMSGSVSQRIGRTMAINPGGSEQSYCFMLLETTNPEKTLKMVRE